MFFLDVNRVGRKASDPRDYIFVLCELVRASTPVSKLPSRIIVPDYTESVATVYRDFTMYMLEGFQDLSVPRVAPILVTSTRSDE